MAVPTIHQGDHKFIGDLVCTGTFRAPSGNITNDMIATDAGILTSKLQHRHRPFLSQVHGSAATAERRVVFNAKAAATVNAITATVSVACVSGATITIDLYKNGSSILTGTFQIDDADAAYASVTGVINNGVLAAGDKLEIVVTVAAGGGTLGQGLFVEVEVDEAAS